MPKFRNPENHKNENMKNRKISNGKKTISLNPGKHEFAKTVKIETTQKW